MNRLEMGQMRDACSLYAKARKTIGKIADSTHQTVVGLTGLRENGRYSVAVEPARLVTSTDGPMLVDSVSAIGDVTFHVSPEGHVTGKNDSRHVEVSYRYENSDAVHIADVHHNSRVFRDGIRYEAWINSAHLAVQNRERRRKSMLQVIRDAKTGLDIAQFVDNVGSTLSIHHEPNTQLPELQVDLLAFESTLFSVEAHEVVV